MHSGNCWPINRVHLGEWPFIPWDPSGAEIRDNPGWFRVSYIVEITLQPRADIWSLTPRQHNDDWWPIGVTDKKVVLVDRLPYSNYRFSGLANISLCAQIFWLCSRFPCRSCLSLQSRMKAWPPRGTIPTLRIRNFVSMLNGKVNNENQILQ